MKFKLPSSIEKPKYIEKKFDNIAKKYDLFNDIITFRMHRYWKRFLVKKIQLKENSKCLDLCCGTGDISTEILKQYPDSNVTGLDFSKEMLKIAKSKTNRISKIKFLLGDAMDISSPDSNFDAVTIGYGLRNVSDIKKCLKEIFRVLKPKGVLVSLDVGKVRMPIISSINNFYFFRIVPLIGNILIPNEDMFHYLPNSSIDYPSQDSIKDLMIEIGFENVQIYNFVLLARGH